MSDKNRIVGTAGETIPVGTTVVFSPEGKLVRAIDENFREGYDRIRTLIEKLLQKKQIATTAIEEVTRHLDIPVR